MLCSSWRPTWVSDHNRTDSFLLIGQCCGSFWCLWIFSPLMLVKVMDPSQNRISRGQTIYILLAVVALCLRDRSSDDTRWRIGLIDKQKEQNPSILTVASLSLLSSSYSLVYTPEKFCVVQNHSQIFEMVPAFFVAVTGQKIMSSNFRTPYKHWLPGLCVFYQYSLRAHFTSNKLSNVNTIRTYIRRYMSQFIHHLFTIKWL